MAKKTYVSPGILLLQAGGDPGAASDRYNPGKDPSLGAKRGQFDDFDDFDDDEFTMHW
ncbi:hypothetical protein [Hoylesella buccalis]|uniref:hypothetical protein n=1 Tax=Hoylesella buccalis TaxID=28127 RepID=UPI000315BD66|nr:hypothetical protein [Hoylesella buccalis]